MDFTEQIMQFSERIKTIRKNISTEEATKTSIILPFFQILGYDVFNPLEFVPEFTADAGTKKGEKVDYAIMVDGEPLILIEAKSANTELNTKHTGQLLRYFTVTKSRFAILTNGIIYRFYSDLEEANKMDTMPFLEFDLFNPKKDLIKELRHFCKDTFDMKDILSSASDLKYITMIKKVIDEQLHNPSDQFIKTILNKNIYSGTKTQAVLDKFREIIKKSFNDYVNDLINERLENAIATTSSYINDESEPKQPIEFTDVELQMLNSVSDIISPDAELTYKKTSGYICMQIGNNSRKWICRIYLRQTAHLFTLHKFEDTDYECEYYFDAIDQLNQIRELIQDTYKKCCNI